MPQLMLWADRLNEQILAIDPFLILQLSFWHALSRFCRERIPAPAGCLPAMAHAVSRRVLMTDTASGKLIRHALLLGSPYDESRPLPQTYLIDRTCWSQERPSTTQTYHSNLSEYHKCLTKRKQASISSEKQYISLKKLSIIHLGPVLAEYNAIAAHAGTGCNSCR